MKDLDEYEIALMKCPDCGKEKKLSIFKGETIRNTFCIKCNHAVIWEKVEDKFKGFDAVNNIL